MTDLVEKHRLAMAEWLDLQDAADILEDTKNDVFAEMCSKYTEASSEAEKQRLCRISHDWKQHRAKVTEAASDARRAKMRVKHWQMCFDEWRTKAANARRELENG